MKLFDKNIIKIKNLVNKMGDLSKITFEQRNFFLYDESNYIKHTFYSEFKGYLRYKMISSQNVSSEAHIKNFFIS